MIELTPPQSEVLQDGSRFRVLVAGRRFGKTFLAITECLRAGWDPGHISWYLAPTYRQAKQVAWEHLQRLAEPFILEKSETDLSIRLVSGGTVALRGAEHYDRQRGVGLDFVAIDEYADMAPEAWTHVIRPALSDRLGRALFISTPLGFNHLYDLFRAAKEQPDWKAFQYTTEQGGNVVEAEIEAARRDLDPAVFRQEYQASFEDLISGRVYYAFSESNIRECDYDPALPLLLCCDFNRDPMSWVLAQAQGDVDRAVIHVLRELVLPDSNTPTACDHFLEIARAMVSHWGYPINVQVYGDATANRGNTAGTRSDWAILKRFFSDHRAYFQGEFHIERSNPLQKDRVAAVNALLADTGHSGFGQRLFVDPCCRELLEDFRRVVWKVDSAGNSTATISKNDPKRTHCSDALGHMVHRQFGFRQRPRFSSLS